MGVSAGEHRTPCQGLYFSVIAICPRARHLRNVDIISKVKIVRKIYVEHIGMLGQNHSDHSVSASRISIFTPLPNCVHLQLGFVPKKVGVAKPGPGNAATLPITVDDGKSHPRMKRFYFSFSLVETKTNYYF